MVRRAIVILIAAIALPQSAWSQKVASRNGIPLDAEISPALRGFDKVVEQALTDFVVPGAAIAIVKDDAVIYARGFGHRDVEAKKAMTPNTLFAIGSTTKAMTATVLGMLVDEGKLEWDAPVRTWLPAFRLQDATISERITPRDLVTHRSGLPRHDLLWYNNTESTRVELIARFAHLELTADLRERFQYNNLMYMTAGYLAGKIEGSTWEAVLRKRLFDPLGMGRTNFSVKTSQMDADFAWPYREKDDELERIPFRNIDLVGPAGSVNSSVFEMTHWLRFNLSGGKADGRALIQPATLADIHAPHMTRGASASRPDISAATYGLGWSIDTYRGHRRISHGGGIDGFITSVMLFPDARLGLVSFNNGQSGISSLINQHAADRLLELENIGWLEEAKERRNKGRATADDDKSRSEAARVAGTSPSHSIGSYAGLYQHAGYGRLEIAEKAGQLQMTFNGIVQPLAHWHYDVWNGIDTEGDPTFEDMKLLFRTDLDGHIAGVELLLEPRGAAIVFEKTVDPRLTEIDFLKKCAGEYETSDGTILTIGLAGDRLTFTQAGQPLMELMPNLAGRFVIAEFRAISFEFVISDDGSIQKMNIHQAGSVAEANRR